MIPLIGDGGVCQADGDCKSNSCMGGRCCNARAIAEEGCMSCSFFGGTCNKCDTGFKRKGSACLKKCECSVGCETCNCGVCEQCAPGYHLPMGRTECVPLLPPGAQCIVGSQCTSGICTGGNCCDADNHAGCADCNSRGKCEACMKGYTLCHQI